MEMRYRYKNMPIYGGGYVTGFMYGNDQDRTLFCRTDVGGFHYFDSCRQVWVPMNEDTSGTDLGKTSPSAMASSGNRLYVASGEFNYFTRKSKGKGILSIYEKRSILEDNHALTWVHALDYEIPCTVHGNLSGRGTGNRLIVVPGQEKELYYASQMDGLFHSTDGGKNWEYLDVCHEKHLTFVWMAPDETTLVVGTAGVDTGNDQFRGHSLYISKDKGIHFEKMLMPENVLIPESRWSGYVAHRYDFDGKYLYVTLTNTGATSFVVPMGYSCDSGDATGGRILRYSFDEKWCVSGYEDITPLVYWDKNGPGKHQADSVLPYGFGGISSCESAPGLLAASTICREHEDMIYISKDYGQTWQVALYDMEVGNMHFNAGYMKPEYNNGISLIHWGSDVKIHPEKPDEVWFNSGTGVFRGENFTKENRSFSDFNYGIEETVHMNVYSPIAGPYCLIDLVGDLGGFCFESPDKPCENTFADEDGHRYITCINADYSDYKPNHVIVTARGNWTGKTKGGLIFSDNYGKDFRRLNMPFGVTEYIDGLCHAIETPNTNPGWVALGADGQGLIYCVAQGHHLYAKGVVYSQDLGESYGKSRFTTQEGIDITDQNIHIKIFSDRIHKDIFYAFGDEMHFFKSVDGGKNFVQIVSDYSAPGLIVGHIDYYDFFDGRSEAGKSGVFYVAAFSEGLLKITFTQENTVQVTKITPEESVVLKVGLGLGREGGDYLRENKAIYICGTLEGKHGFYRSLDGGASWIKINDDTQNFGMTKGIDGDPRKFGRVYVGTSGFGVKYGDPYEEYRTI